MRFGLFAAIIVAFVLPFGASAQSLGDLGSAGTSFTVSVAPQYPAPNSPVTLSFLSSSIDLANALMSVSVAGKNIYKGSVQPVSITLGKAGSVTSVSVTISSAGANYTQALSVQPQDVSLVAEPISSSPPLYPGKPSVPLEGNVRVVAVANLRSASGQALNPTTLAYSWTVDGTQIANSSGIGKQAVIVASPLQYRSRDVSVDIMSPDGRLVGGSSITLSSADPIVRVYENDPLLGIRFERALADTFAIPGAEATLFAAPFSFPTSGGPPFMQWLLNNAPAQSGSSITLRPTGSGRGSASLSLTASSGSYTTATQNLSLSFGSSPSFNLFGL